MLSVLVLLLTFPVLVALCLVRRAFRTPRTAAFFHPNCAAGGGGEHVLWQMVAEILASFPTYSVVIYTAGDPSRDATLAAVHETFGLDLAGDAARIRLVPLSITARLLLPQYYPFFTLLLQALGSIVTGVYALLRFTPEVFIDTTGFAFTYPFAWLAGSTVVTYTHYPTISTDMLAVVAAGKTAVNNRAWIARNRMLSFLKHKYYAVFAWMYRRVGRFASVVLVNGTWTGRHITQLWGGHPTIVYPPCDISLADAPTQHTMHRAVSIGQFRPEKQHLLQVDVVARLLSDHPELKQAFRLTMIGGCRDEEDRKRKEAVRRAVVEKGLEDVVEVPERTSYEEKVRYLEEAEIGLHTMANEHFGICVVEYMGYGLVPIAHKSAGPLLDIVGDDRRCGYLATTVDEYAECVYLAITQPETTWEMRVNAIQKAREFSVDAFRANCRDVLLGVLENPSTEKA